MERIIEVDINDTYDLVERYNSKKVSGHLIDYIIGSTIDFRKDDVVKIVINTKLKDSEDIARMIIEGLENEFNRSLKRHRYINLLQVIYLVAGLFILFLSTQIGIEVFKEFVLISGWVFIWFMLELEMFSDSNGRRKRRILKKLLNSEFVVNKI